MTSLRYTTTFSDGVPVDPAAADRLLGLGDQFIENWADDDAQAHAAHKDPELAERRGEWATVRPLFAASPSLLSVCVEIARAGAVNNPDMRARLNSVIAEAGGWPLLDPRCQAIGLQAMAESRVEPLTIAYVAMGVQDAIRQQPQGLPTKVTDAYEGEMNFVDAVVSEAWRLDAIERGLSANDDYINTVFSYEIAGPFGQRMAEALIAEKMEPDGPTADPDAIARQVFEEDLEPEQRNTRDYATLLLQGAMLLTRRLDGSSESEQDVLDAEYQRITEALPEGEGDYDDGYRDALQSVMLALAQAGVPSATLRDALTTALDAHANNVPETLKPR